MNTPFLFETVREYRDGNGRTVRFKVELETGPVFEQELQRLAIRAREAKRGVATSAGGTLRVTLLKDQFVLEGDSLVTNK